MSPWDSHLCYVSPSVEKESAIVLYLSWNCGDQPLQHVWQIKHHWGERGKCHSHQQSGLELHKENILLVKKKNKTYFCVKFIRSKTGYFFLLLLCTLHDGQGNRDKIKFNNSCMLSSKYTKYSPAVYQSPVSSHVADRLSPDKDWGIKNYPPSQKPHLSFRSSPNSRGPQSFLSTEQANTQDGKCWWCNLLPIQHPPRLLFLLLSLTAFRREKWYAQFVD